MKTRIAGTIALIAAAITMNSVYAEQAQCNKDQKQGKAAKTQKTENRLRIACRGKARQNRRP